MSRIAFHCLNKIRHKIITLLQMGIDTGLCFIGFVSAVIIGIDKLYSLAHGIPQRLVTDSPYFYIALTMMVIGTQLFLTGFLGDLVSRNSSNRNDYQIAEKIRCSEQ